MIVVGIGSPVIVCLVCIAAAAAAQGDMAISGHAPKRVGMVLVYSHQSGRVWQPSVEPRIRMKLAPKVNGI